MKEFIELDLFDNEKVEVKKPRFLAGGSRNPIIFHDYDSFVAKFRDNPKTTDDTFTPKDVYESVLYYISSNVDMNGKLILRPFYPGGDYKNADYPDNGIVIDNPPFSIFMEIIRFYTKKNIPFFLFGQGKTIMGCIRYCTAIIVETSITYDNGAKIYTNFASNLFGNTAAMTAPLLNDLIRSCASQNKKAHLPSYKYPDELLSFSQLQTICRNGYDYRVKKSECTVIRDLDNHPKSLFGDHLLLNVDKTEEKIEALSRDYSTKASKCFINVPLSEREKEILKQLG